MNMYVLEHFVFKHWEVGNVFYLTPWYKVFLAKLGVVQLVKKCPDFMDLRYSQEQAIAPCPVQVESRAYLHILSL
jgi:hypothetical protein